MDASVSIAKGAESRWWAYVGVSAAVAAFAAALVSQYGFGWLPCPLCIWQRYPYVIGLALAGLALAPGAGGVARLLLASAALVFAVGAGLGVFHSGVEWAWWDGLASCSTPQAEGVSAGDLLAQLEAAPLIRCDDRQPFLFGLSMANWNVLTSAAIAACFARAARRPKRATVQATA